MATSENITPALAAAVRSAGYAPVTPDEQIISAVNFLHSESITPGGGGGAASFASVSGQPYDNAAMASVFRDATTTTRAALIALGSNAVVGTTYKINNAAPIQNVAAFPIYIICQPETLLSHGNALMLFTTTTADIVYSIVEDKIYSVYWVNNGADIKATEDNSGVHTSLNGFPAITPNCVKFAIETIELGAVIANYNVSIKSSQIDGYSVTNPGLAFGVNSWDIHPECHITMGQAVSCYYWTLFPGCIIVVGDNSLAYYLVGEMYSRLTMANDSFSYWMNLWSGAYAIMGVGAKSSYDWLYGGGLDDGAIDTAQIITWGAGSVTINCRFYQGVTAVLPAGKTWNNKEMKVGSSNFDDTFDVAASTTPNMQTVNTSCMGYITLSCTAAAITPTTLQNLRPNFIYRFYIATGKTITFPANAYFKLKGAVDFVGVGTSGDWIEIKTNATATAAFEILRSNY